VRWPRSAASGYPTHREHAAYLSHRRQTLPGSMRSGIRAGRISRRCRRAPGSADRPQRKPATGCSLSGAHERFRRGLGQAHRRQQVDGDVPLHFLVGRSVTVPGLMMPAALTSTPPRRCFRGIRPRAPVRRRRRSAWRVCAPAPAWLPLQPAAWSISPAPAVAPRDQPLRQAQADAAGPSRDHRCLRHFAGSPMVPLPSCAPALAGPSELAMASFKNMTTNHICKYTKKATSPCAVNQSRYSAGPRSLHHSKTKSCRVRRRAQPARSRTNGFSGFSIPQRP